MKKQNTNEFDNLLKTAFTLLDSEEYEERQKLASDRTLYDSIDHSDLEENIHNLIKKEAIKNRRKEFFKKSYTKVAVILLCFFLFSGITIGSVGALRVRFFNFFFNPEAPNTDFIPNKGDFYSDDDVILNYLPWGFEIYRNVSNENRIHKIFSKDEQDFTISISRATTNISLDTEQGDMTDVFVNGLKGYFVTIQNRDSLVWYDEDHTYRISGTISREEMLKIAENFDVLKK